MVRLPRFYGLETHRSASERDAFVRTIAGAGYDPVGIAAVIESETGGTWDPAIRGVKAFSMAPGYAVGLLQFSPDTAKSLGTSTYQLEQMSFLDQLPFVAAYYGKFGGPSSFSAPGDYYLAGWGASPRSADDKVLASSGSKAYDLNKGLDWNGDGTITAGDLRAIIDGKVAKATARGTWEFDAEQTPSIAVRVEDPNGVLLGSAYVTEADAVGLMTLQVDYGAPTMIAYPNGIRVLRFAPGVLINARSNLPIIGAQKAPSFGWEHAAFVLSIAGLGATVFFGTLSIRPGRRYHHAR